MNANASPDFQRIVSCLFRLMELPGDPTGANSPGYTVNLDGKLAVELIGVQEGYLSMLSIVGELPANADSATLRTLVHANEFTFDHPPICLGLDRKTGRITLWTRQSLGELNEQATVILFERFTGMAERVRQWLASGGAKRSALADGMRKSGASTRPGWLGSWRADR